MINKTDFGDTEGPFSVLRLKNYMKECMKQMKRGWMYGVQ
jgi:hypothetical protein